MATGHATYSTVHADSAKSLIHRLEGKPIEIPRIMLQSLDVVSIHITTRVKGKRVRRAKQIIEIIDIDPTTKEILTNEVFRWDPIEDRFVYTGKSYVLEGIRAKWDISKEEITQEIRRRAEVLEWMQAQEVRTFKEVAKAISHYAENSKDFLKKIRQTKGKKIINEKSPDEVEELKEAAAEKIDAFKDVKSIDTDTAALLYENGYTSMDALKNASVKDLSKIKDIKKKTAKNIIKEVKEI
jgi:hypothetical protein